jgi:exosortase/archaeosortase family protein
MDAVKVNDIKGWLEAEPARKLGLWLLLSLMLSIILSRDFWTALPSMLSPGRILGQHQLHPWGVLALCLVVLCLKREEILKGINSGRSLVIIPLGLALVGGAVLMPSLQDYLVFRVLLASLGVFIIVFRTVAKVPLILLAIYGFSISLPLAVQRFAESGYSRSAIVPLMWVMTTLRYPLQNEGQWMHLTSKSGEVISTAITAACAGPATMGVFIAIFALMMLDKPLPPQKAAGLFIFGAAGTWFQSFIRMMILMLIAYYFGKDAMWTAHSWTIYILFPLWYLLFAYVYFQQVRMPPGDRGEQECMYIAATGR